MSFVIRTFSTTCIPDLLDAINANVVITTQCIQIIDTKDGDLLFEFVGDLPSNQTTELDLLLSNWVCPIVDLAGDQDSESFVDDTADPSDDVIWSSEKVQQEINGALSGIGDRDVPVILISKTTTSPLPLSYADVNWDQIDIQNDSDTLELDPNNSQRVLIKTTGLYVINYNASVDADSGEETFDFRVMVDDTSICPGSLRTISEDDEINAVSNSVPCQLNAGQYITLQVQASGGGNILGVSTNMSVVSLRSIKGEQGEKGDTGDSGSALFEIQQNGDQLPGTFDTLNLIGDFDLSDSGNGVVDVILPDAPDGGVFGTEFYSVESLSTSTTTSTSYTLKVRLTTGNLPSGTYRIGWAFSWNHNSASNDYIGRVQLNNNTDLSIIRIEPKDTSGSFGSTGTDQQIPASGFAHKQLSGVNFIDIDYGSSSSGTLSAIWNARIELWRVS